MEINQGLFTFVVALAAVINGLGIVRIIGGLGDYLRQRETLNVSIYWVYLMLVLFQLCVHILIWWGLIALREVGTINFLQYLYVLLGPTLLFLATSLLTPNILDNSVDLRIEYKRVRKPYYSISSVFQAWSIAIWPILGYPMAPTWIFAACWMVIMIILRVTENSKVHAVLVSAIWLLLVAYVGTYAMQLGGVSSLMNQ